MPSLADARSVAAVPLLAQAEVAGVLYLESREQGAFGAQNERLLRVVGAHLASVLRSLDSAGIQEGSVRGADEEPAAAGERLSVTYYQADDSVFVGDEYVIKGVPGRILWKLLREHAANGREAFTNRELRLDERLGLPPGAPTGSRWSAPAGAASGFRSRVRSSCPRSRRADRCARHTRRTRPNSVLFRSARASVAMS
jgi:hypothetical protein